MKRLASKEPAGRPGSPKRARGDSVESLFSDESLERPYSAIESLLAEGNHHGWIGGSVEVKWGLMRGRLRFQLLSTAGERLEVQFHGNEASQLTLSVRDSLRISLRGAQTISRRSGAAQCQFILTFPDGFCIYQKPVGKDTAIVTDVWQST